ncbi:hypothetical protein GOC54_15880 [Sinorhizobium meliloti]|nr:hypothetical protein [Sinorhizobium meliloti]
MQDRAFHAAGPAHQCSPAAESDVHPHGCVSGLTRSERRFYRTGLGVALRAALSAAPEPRDGAFPPFGFDR